MPTLFDPLQAGNLNLRNRCVMAPLTRSRAGDSRVPNDLMVEYYTQRSSAGMIVTEATAISFEGYGWKGAPAAYTDEMERGWTRITEAVHAKGGTIVLQLWHEGRLSHPKLLNGDLPLAPSAIAAEGANRSLSKDDVYVVPKPMTQDDIDRTINDFAEGAKFAIRAGFDGVEIHGANGYLIDQFLKDGSNTRTDQYGGGVENRARFLLQVVAAVTAAIGSGRTGLRLSPQEVQSAADSDPMATFTHVAKLLNPAKLAYLHIKEPSRNALHLPVTAPVAKSMRELYDGVMILNEGYDSHTAQAAIDAGLADAIAFGVPWIANPDYVERLRTGAPLNTPDQKTFYAPGPHGYTDYPFMPSGG